MGKRHSAVDHMPPHSMPEGEPVNCLMGMGGIGKAVDALNAGAQTQSA